MKRPWDEGRSDVAHAVQSAAGVAGPATGLDAAAGVGTGSVPAAGAGRLAVVGAERPRSAPGHGARRCWFAGTG